MRRWKRVGGVRVFEKVEGKKETSETAVRKEKVRVRHYSSQTPPKGRTAQPK